MKAFAKRLYLARKKKKWTQMQLAKQLGIKQAYVSRYETGKDEPSDAIKKHIAELLEVSPDYLMGNTPDESSDLPDPNEAKTLAHRIRVVRNYYRKSQTEFARELGIGQSTLSAIETGMTTPSIEILQRLGRMGFNLEWLLYGENTQLPNDQIILKEPAKDIESARIYALLRELSEDHLKLWRQMLEVFIASEKH